MAYQPSNYGTKQSLQPGGRGEIFQQDLPGHRGQGDRINRTNMKLAVSEHDVPNIKWDLDRRLPVLFRYGWAAGYNQITLPKGRIVSVDKTLNIMDFDTHKAYGAITMANGGADVILRDSNYKNIQDEQTAPVGIGTQWTPVKEDVYVKTDTEVIYRPFADAAALLPLAECEEEGKDGKAKKTKKVAAVRAAGVVGVDPATGLATLDGKVREDVRLGNIPVGVLERNEYTRNDNAYNGMNVGPVLTDKLIEIPMFLIKEKAEMNPWGSAYGIFLPGDYVKSDENGRFIVSPLSRQEVVKTMTAGEIELERQQIVGQVFNVSRDLVPAGAAKYAQWALSDRLNFDEFNPDIWRANGRDGEDNIDHSPYKPNGGGYINNSTDMTGRPFTEQPGYPYDRTMSQHDLHMLASSARSSNNRFEEAHQLERGIPGLTDGYNVISRELGPESLGKFKQAASENDYKEMFFTTAEQRLESMKITVTTGVLNEEEFIEVNPQEVGQKVDLKGASTVAGAFMIHYVDLKQGIVVLKANPEKLTELHAAMKDKEAQVFVKYNRRGMSGIPTNLDWDGCAGVLTVLLQK